MQTTIGGDRLGSGKKMKASFNNYERSTHDLGYLWRSTMSAGTLVPFMAQVALPGDTFDIDLNCMILTHPTIGPLFGSYKVQLDVFQVPVRLYHSALHNNMLEIGMKMNTIKLPKIKVTGKNQVDHSKPIDNQQINPSSILSYLGIRGVGFKDNGGIKSAQRKFNAIPYLAYWDIYKNYYANKMEGIGACIHTAPEPVQAEIAEAYIDEQEIDITNLTTGSYVPVDFQYETRVRVIFTDLPEGAPIEGIMIVFKDAQNVRQDYPLIEAFEAYDIFDDVVTFHHYKGDPNLDGNVYGIYWDTSSVMPTNETKPSIKTFDLKEIDNMRIDLLASTPAAEYIVDETSPEPYGLPFQHSIGEDFKASILYSQEGLGLKTYQSDLFNNWLDTEWIDGVDGISAITAVSTAGDSFTIDELNLSKKVYDMLNRIALSGGTYDDWLSAVYTHERNRGQENPAYIGGLIKELVFQEVISNAGTADDPLGTLAGRGVLANKHKGGKIICKVDEPSYIIGIVSLTPRIDYSQGNSWDTNLKTMDDFHKPALDEIGFQDLITDKMAWFDTKINTDGTLTFKSAGKQPAWLDYMTSTNVVRGNFADSDNQMFMVLNRRYESKKQPASNNLYTIKDLTTYIDPSKFNHIFADARLDSQNFWAQISVDITARRKMSAKLIPNL